MLEAAIPGYPVGEMATRCDPKVSVAILKCLSQSEGARRIPKVSFAMLKCPSQSEGARRNLLQFNVTA